MVILLNKGEIPGRFSEKAISGLLDEQKASIQFIWHIVGT